MGKTIRKRSESWGIIYHIQPPSSTVCIVSVSLDVIHLRLGHPSLDKLKCRFLIFHIWSPGIL